MDNNFDDFFNNGSIPGVNNEETQTPVEEKETPPKKKFSLDLKNDRVLFIQILLIAIWLVLTLLIYFFGYDLFSPFIEV